MRFYGYYMNGKNYDCTETAKKKAEKAAAEKGLKVYKASYKV